MIQKHGTRTANLQHVSTGIPKQRGSGGLGTVVGSAVCRREHPWGKRGSDRATEPLNSSNHSPSDIITVSL